MRKLFRMLFCARDCRDCKIISVPYKWRPYGSCSFLECNSRLFLILSFSPELEAVADRARAGNQIDTRRRARATMSGCEFSTITAMTITALTEADRLVVDRSECVRQCDPSPVGQQAGSSVRKSVGESGGRVPRVRQSGWVGPSASGPAMQRSEVAERSARQLILGKKCMPRILLTDRKLRVTLTSGERNTSVGSSDLMNAL